MEVMDGDAVGKVEGEVRHRGGRRNVGEIGECVRREVMWWGRCTRWAGDVFGLSTFSLFWLIFTHRTLLKQPKSADFLPANCLLIISFQKFRLKTVRLTSRKYFYVMKKNIVSLIKY